MKFRTISSDNDWTFGRGIGNYSSLNSATGLNIKTRLQSWVGDCFFSMRSGIDWLNRLGSKNQRDLLEQDLRRVILQSEGVTGILEFDTILNGRNLSVFYSVSTIYTENFQETVSVSI